MANPIGQIGVEENKTFIGGVHSARLHHISTIGWATAVAQRADFALFKQGHIVITPDEIHIACHQSAIEPGVAFQLQRVLLADKVGIFGHQAASRVEVNSLRLSAFGGFNSGVFQGQIFQREHIRQLHQKHWTTGRTRIQSFRVLVLDQHPFATFTGDRQVVFVTQIQQLVIGTVVDGDSRRIGFAQVLHHIIERALQRAEIRAAASIVHGDGGQTGGRSRFGGKGPAGVFTYTFKWQARQSRAGEGRAADRHIVAGVVLQLFALQGDGHSITRDADGASIERAHRGAIANGVFVIDQFDGIHERIIAAFEDAN